MERIMSTDYSAEPKCIAIDGSGAFLSQAFLESVAELYLNTTPDPRGVTPTPPRHPSRLPEDRIVASATATSSTGLTTSCRLAV